jgi:hypothetical protein
MLRKLLEPRIWRRIYRERLGEPLIYNVASAFVALFGNIVKKIDYDLVARQPYAFGLQEAFRFAADERQRLGVSRLVFIEFGVASGAGLLNICRIAAALSRHYDIDYRVVGFDTGEGMPPPVDYRDHPEKYLDGDFAPHDTAALQRSLPANAQIIYGPIRDTVGQLHTVLEPGDVIGFISIDVDYWSSTKDCMKLFDSLALSFLPRTPVYFDDVNNVDHNPFAGELLAIDEFNVDHTNSKISKMNQLRNWRIFKNALWLDQLYWYFKFDHPYFTRDYHAQRGRTKLSNPYLGMKLEQNAETKLGS